MKKDLKFTKPVWIGIAILSVLIILGAAFSTYAFLMRNKGSEAINPTAIMSVSSRGGLCSHGPCAHRVYNIFENGKFEGHTQLTEDEVVKLKKVITNTDFKAYGKNNKLGPSCASYADGSDRVFYFPEKYGDMMVIPCELEIPLDDKVFSYLNSVIKTHTPEE